MIGHHFITICRSGTRALPDTGHDLGGRLDWVGCVCLHDLLPAVHSLWRGAVRWVSDTLPIYATATVDLAAWPAILVHFRFVPPSGFCLIRQCAAQRTWNGADKLCWCWKGMACSSVLPSSRMLLKFGHLKCDRHVWHLFEGTVLHCKRRVEPVTHPFFISLAHQRQNSSWQSATIAEDVALQMATARHIFKLLPWAQILKCLATLID